jgi:uncharacterized protein YndB with AHSA1/START domain
MNEFNQFTKKQKVSIVAFAVGFIIMLFALVQIVIWCVTDEASVKATEPKVYQVMGQDEDGYYVAMEVLKVEDGSYVPYSYFDEYAEERLVVYLPEDVEGRLPDVDDLVHIRMNAYGENPVVTPY